MMAPTLVLGPDGDVLALGSGGSKRIRTAIGQVVSALVDHGEGRLDLTAAVEAPRVHWDGEVVQVEPGHGRRGARSTCGAAGRSTNGRPATSTLEASTRAPGRGGAGDPRRGGVTRSVAE